MQISRANAQAADCVSHGASRQPGGVGIGRLSVPSLHMGVRTIDRWVSRHSGWCWEGSGMSQMSKFPVDFWSNQVGLVHEKDWSKFKYIWSTLLIWSTDSTFLKFRDSHKVYVPQIAAPFECHVLCEFLRQLHSASKVELTQTVWRGYLETTLSPLLKNSFWEDPRNVCNIQTELQSMVQVSGSQSKMDHGFLYEVPSTWGLPPVWRGYAIFELSQHRRLVSWHAGNVDYWTRCC